MKRLAKRVLRAAGFELRRIHAKWNPAYGLALALDHFDVDLVLDIGANAGQSARELRVMGYDGAIVSFEPLSGAHRRLERTASGDPNWQVHPRCAVGDSEGEAVLNVSHNSVSSSLRSMLDAHRVAALESEYTGRETVTVRRLDAIVEPYLRGRRRPFLKIDTQGFEKQVLDGARNTLRHACGVHCELSLVPLYDGQALWDEVRAEIEDLGFTLWSLHPGFTDQHTGRSLQVDGTFFRVKVQNSGQDTDNSE